MDPKREKKIRSYLAGATWYVPIRHDRLDFWMTPDRPTHRVRDWHYSIAVDDSILFFEVPWVVVVVSIVQFAFLLVQPKVPASTLANLLTQKCAVQRLRSWMGWDYVLFKESSVNGLCCFTRHGHLARFDKKCETGEIPHIGGSVLDLSDEEKHKNSVNTIDWLDLVPTDMYLLHFSGRTPFGFTCSQICIYFFNFCLYSIACLCSGARQSACLLDEPRGFIKITFKSNLAFA